MANKGYAGSNEGRRAESGEREPKGDDKADRSGERKGKTVNGVGMGMADKTGADETGKGRSGMGGVDRGEYNSGRTEGSCYNHKRLSHPQGNKGS